MSPVDVPPPVFLNLEYVFFLFYKNIGKYFAYFFSKEFWDDIRVAFTIIAILLIALIIYCLVRLWELKKESDKKKQQERINLAGASGISVVSAKNDTWESIKTKFLSDDEKGWRLGIIEADIYLDKILREKGYIGETLSDRLKQISPENLPSIQMAWEAHKIRNKIAHDGDAFIITRPEARRTLSYFEAVFKDLGVIDELA